MPTPYARTVGLAAIALLIAAALWALPSIDAAFVEHASRRIGPVAIIGLVALGIVVSPIPSGAVALGAGAIYGALTGGLLTIAGAVLGAACAFRLSRSFGRGPALGSSFRLARFLTSERSQASLMAIIFVTRLIPFISFDAVSYVAGLTPIRFWQFVMATAAGTAPVCFAFSAAGASAKQGAMHPVLLTGLCAITLVLPLLYAGRRAARPSAGAPA
ncbi:MAG: VTT domain-containing protein [Paracoccaceae bacterium]|nr:VTT domain-containing protein [Paracoccaceae bacterium]